MTIRLDERVHRALAVLDHAERERQIVQGRLHSLREQMDRLITEITWFETVVHCADATTCLLENDVRQVLAGS